MARINSQVLFLTTSPRTPEKMIPELGLLVKNFEQEKWNKKSQELFMEILRDEQFFNGTGTKDPAFSARDRINRGPKSLGFVVLSPKITLTDAGKRLLDGKRTEEVFLRQLLKFQIPSPYHRLTNKATAFCVKPYLEILRLIRVLGTLQFDELHIFGMQLTDWHKFNEIIDKVKQFRVDKVENKNNYRSFKAERLRKELVEIYSERIVSGETKTRETNDSSLEKFLNTQSRNMRDYADACFRYLRATGLVCVSYVGKSLSIVRERLADVDYILNNIDRNPCFVDNEKRYIEYLGNPNIPNLLTDNRQSIINRLNIEFREIEYDQKADTEDLKELLYDLIGKRKATKLQEQVNAIKDYKSYNDIQNTYKQIENNELYDAPLMLEWNTWRAMTMLDSGNIKANLNFDDFGNPLSTAQGNMADVVCDYGDFYVSVEVTMSSGQRQFEMEGEPVTRHLGKLKSATGKPCYCLFVAPTINEACVAHFYTLHTLNISYYGGKSTIVPLPLTIFKKMLEDSYRADYVPSPNHIRNFFEYSNDLVQKCANEKEWFEEIKKKAANWLDC